MTVQKLRIHPRGGSSRLKLRAILAQSGLADVNPLKEDVFLQIRATGGATDLLCAMIPASHFMIMHGKFLFWDHQHTVTRLRVHRKLVGLFSAALAAIHANAEAWASLGDTGGAYAWRPQRGAKRLSRHCWAIALDLDVGDNPLGGKPHMHPAVIAAFAAQGFEWGGAWKRRKDPMHFEFADLGRLAIPAGGSGPVA